MLDGWGLMRSPLARVDLFHESERERGGNRRCLTLARRGIPRSEYYPEAQALELHVSFGLLSLGFYLSPNP
jgi:hypothetical protein